MTGETSSRRRAGDPDPTDDEDFLDPRQRRAGAIRSGRIPRCHRKAKGLCSTQEPAIERHDTTAEERSEGQILGVVGLRPAEPVGDQPRLAAEPLRRQPSHGTTRKRLGRGETIVAREIAPPDQLMQSGAGLRPHERRRNEIAISEDVEPGVRETGGNRHARVDNEGQCPRRDCARAATIFGIGRPERVAFHAFGSGSISPSPRDPSRSASSITCCVPTLRARSRPERIQRRIVSGSRPAFRAASGTVSIGVAYYNIHASQTLTDVVVKVNGYRSVPINP